MVTFQYRKQINNKAQSVMAHVWNISAHLCSSARWADDHDNPDCDMKSRTVDV